LTLGRKNVTIIIVTKILMTYVITKLRIKTLSVTKNLIISIMKKSIITLGITIKKCNTQQKKCDNQYSDKHPYDIFYNNSQH
jgi:hypothetical protein